MELRPALKEQYHASFAMLAECVEKCSDEMWVSGEHPRTFWRIAFHAAFFAQLYMGQNEQSLQPWPGTKPGVHEKLWTMPADLEPYELPEEAEIYSQSEMLDYIRFVDGLVDSTIDQLDLSTDDSGFWWYKKTSKLSHEIMNIRHIQGHVGQLSELLMAKGTDTDWIGRAGAMGSD